MRSSKTVAGGTGIRAAARLAWPACGLSLALIACAIALAAVNRTLDPGLIYLAGIVACAVVGGLVSYRRPANPVGWLFLGSALSFALQEFAIQYAVYGQRTAPGSLPLAQAMAWPPSWLWVPGVALAFVFLPLYFPNGRLLSRRWRPVVLFGAGASALAAVAFALFNRTADDITGLANPFATAEPMAGVILGVPTALLFVAMLASAISLAVRFRRSRDEERQQIKWAASAAIAVPVVNLGAALAEEAAPALAPLNTASNLVWAVVPVAVGIAILKHRLYDIDVVINRTLVYVALTVIVVGIYVLVVGYLGAMFRTGGNLAISLVATGIVAVLFQPMRERLQSAVNRLMYGERDDPYKVLSRLGESLENALAPEAALATVAESVAQALKLPHAAVALEENGDFITTAEFGNPVGESVVLPLIHHSEEVGRMVVSPRSPGEEFSPADRRLLDDLARQAGAAAHAARLTKDLKRSRERLVAAREEERRRLRRDLHDGLGPRLATLALKHDAAMNLLSHDPKAVGELLAELKAETREAIADVRRVVHNLRPPALDQLGLVRALEEWTHRRPGGTKVSLEAPEDVPPLPAAVEVAAYRIVQEALTNVARHAEARKCTVRLALDETAETLLVEISDDGRGIGEVRGQGVGLSSMRERAEELGGSFGVEALSGGGTRVRAGLPLRLDPAEASGEDVPRERGITSSAEFREKEAAP